MNMPPDGALSGEDLPGSEESAAVAMAQMRQAAMARQAAMPWRPACVNCLNGHKLAIAELVKKLNSRGLQVGDPQFQQAMQAAQQAGAMFAQNPMMAIGQNGSKPDMIPPVRPMDTIVNGNAVCALCFQPQQHTSLLIAPGGWTPGR
jgi:hypothetical protein